MDAPDQARPVFRRLPLTAGQASPSIVEQPQGHALRIQEAANRVQHSADEFIRRWRSRQNVQTIRQRFDLPARYLLGSAQRLFGAFALSESITVPTNSTRFPASSQTG